MEQDKFVINIGRQLGSGGKAVGEALGRRLGVHVYDKQLINLAAEQSGLCTELFEQADEKKSRSLFSSLIGYLRMPFGGDECGMKAVSVKRICEIVDGPVSAESVAMTRDEIIRDGRELAALADNVVVKIPTMVEGLAATKALSEEGIPVNMTLCFSVPQAIMAARAGARYISPFVGRFDDIAEDGISQLADVVAAVNNYDFGHDVEIIAASVRSANHVTQAALMGADIATVPFAALKKCVQHPLTDRGLDAFMKDWEKVQQA